MAQSWQCLGFDALDQPLKLTGFGEHLRVWDRATLPREGRGGTASGRQVCVRRGDGVRVSENRDGVPHESTCLFRPDRLSQSVPKTLRRAATLATDLAAVEALDKTIAPG